MKVLNTKLQCTGNFELTGSSIKFVTFGKKQIILSNYLTNL